MKRIGAPSLQVRIVLSNGYELEPGKAALLEAIVATGSIAAGARALGISYKHAWKLVGTLNSTFASPLVRKTPGGPRGGAASLTQTGGAVLATYRAIEKIASESVAANLQGLHRLAES
jgi:molybdate transport system regulatory protein